LGETLQGVFGFASFRPGQEQAIRALLEHKRILCIQPTGYGKSLLYQLPAVLLEGMTLVISPLLALVRDQIDHLRNRFQIPAASINSDQSDAENEAARRAALEGRVRILFIAPEQLDNLVTQAFASKLPVDLLVVDEAHCISTWGHDFRPSYRQIVKAVRDFEGRRSNLHVLGLTATADEKTETDIAQQLGSLAGEPLGVLRASMDRNNISLSVVPVRDFGDKLAWLGARVPDWDGSGILYCATRENTELVADYLKEQGMDVVSYHAGYDPDCKRALQGAFIRGEHKAIAATNALGMGIDKPDVRFIVHVDVPGSITAYYQEVGRAGRDGKPAQGVLLFDPQDSRIQEHFIRSAQPTRKDFEAVLGSVVSDPEGLPPTVTGIKVRSGLHPTKVNVILAELAEQGLVEKKLAQRRQVYERTGTAVEPDLGRYERQLAVRTKELQAMLRYGRGEVECLMHALRLALGDRESEPCGRCSLCAPDWHEAETGQPIGTEAREWLNERPVRIPAVSRPAMCEGIALLDSQLRSPLFLEFMHGRGSPGRTVLAEELQKLVRRKLAALASGREFAAVVPLPSRTWAQRGFTSKLVADALGAPLEEELLTWRETPANRQGVLLNNDQRRENVRGKMTLSPNRIPSGGGAILLLDDYAGSFSTLKEAARAIRKESGFEAEIVPFTVARVRWRLGAPGMV
jgi:ATP-dependent DNA helicase RecQ